MYHYYIFTWQQSQNPDIDSTNKQTNHPSRKKVSPLSSNFQWKYKIPFGVKLTQADCVVEKGIKVVEQFHQNSEILAKNKTWILKV